MKLKIKKETLIISSFLILLTIITCYGMPMDWCEKKPLSDSTWYMYFGHAMKKGQLMYVDIFDHKGPLLFFINYIGMLISENFGVWIMCTAAIFMFYIFSYKTARLVTSKVFSLLVISLSAVCICGCLQGGNYADLYSMPFIMYSVYVYLSFFINEESVKKYQILLVGICGACSFMLRANLIAPWLCFSFFILLYLLHKRKFKSLLIMCGLFLSGIVIAITPFLIYFISNNCLSEAINASILFNFKYTGAGSLGWFDMFRWSYEYLQQYYIVIILLLYICFIAFKRKNIYMHTANLVYIGASLILLCISKRPYLHYMLVFIPCIIFPAAYLCSFIKKQHKKLYLVAGLLVIFASNIFVINDHIKSNRSYWNSYSNEYMEIAQIIKNNTGKDDTIYTHNLNGAIYVKADRLSATRYFALPAVNIDNFPELQNEFLSDIENNKPRMIVIDSRYLRLTRDTDRKLMSIIDKNYSVFTKQESVTLYKLKEM